MKGKNLYDYELYMNFGKNSCDRIFKDQITIQHKSCKETIPVLRVLLLSPAKSGIYKMDIESKSSYTYNICFPFQLVVTNCLAICLNMASF